jgi:hypothetical protein
MQPAHCRVFVRVNAEKALRECGGEDDQGPSDTTGDSCEEGADQEQQRQQRKDGYADPLVQVEASDPPDLWIAALNERFVDSAARGDPLDMPNTA